MMKHQNRIQRTRLCRLALLLALLLLATACAPAGGTSSDPSGSEPEQFPGENTSGSSSAPEERDPSGSDPAESSPASSLPEDESKPSVSTLPEGDPPEESVPEESGSESSESGDPPVQEVFGDTFCYVALGDSICRGYGLNDPEAQRYSSLIGERTGCTVYNYGVDGQTGAELLTFLRDGKAEALSKADVISVSIGANNLLRTLSSLLLSLIGSLKPTTSDTELPVDTEDFYAAVDEALASFGQELPELLELLGTQAPNARILFQTVYNPYRSFTHFPLRLNGTTVYLADLANECVDRLNDMIRDGALQYGYTVCDVYDAFEQSAEQLVNASLSKLNFDPHPNAAGHTVIADVLLQEMPKLN